MNLIYPEEHWLIFRKTDGERLPWYQYKEPLINKETVDELEKRSERE